MLYTWAPGTCIRRAAESFYGKFRDEWLSLKWRRAEAKGCDRKVAPALQRDAPAFQLGCLTPAAVAAKIKGRDAAPVQATGRSAAVCGASALRPVAQPPRKGQTKAATGAVVSS